MMTPITSTNLQMPMMLEATEANHDYGTFKDSLRAPVHRWFTYPAGFSHKAVAAAFQEHSIKVGMNVFDPFGGTATTNIVAKQLGVNSFGIEAHPFVYFVGKTKLFWDFNFDDLEHRLTEVLSNIKEDIFAADLSRVDLKTVFPELVLKCYGQENLARLYILRECVERIDSEHIRSLFKLGLTAVLRSASDVGTGWPYIAPKKAKRVVEGGRDVFGIFAAQITRMYQDLLTVRYYDHSSKTVFKQGDARVRQPELEEGSIQLAFTSPPYLNNYDYADRTRLETYFFGQMRSWADITEQVRTKLMMSATTQINRRNYDESELLDVPVQDSLIGVELQGKVQQLSTLRLEKGGKKSYDIMVAGYFNDMYKVLSEVYRVLEPGRSLVMILGDSAPYGVYIPTHDYLGVLGRQIGFTSYDSTTLRGRGDKWRDNPQRHHVTLKECIVTLTK